MLKVDPFEFITYSKTASLGNLYKNISSDPIGFVDDTRKVEIGKWTCTHINESDKGEIRLSI